MIPLVIGALLAAAALVWVIAPVFAGEAPRARAEPAGAAAVGDAIDDAAAEAAIRKWRTPG